MISPSNRGIELPEPICTNKTECGYSFESYADFLILSCALGLKSDDTAKISLEVNTIIIFVYLLKMVEIECPCANK